MSRAKLNIIKTNTLALNRISKGAKSAPVQERPPEEIPEGYQGLIDNNSYSLKDASGKIIIVPIEDEESGEDAAKPIKFKFYDKEYDALEGMTWYEWCKSEYNTDGWECDGPDDYVYTWRQDNGQWDYEYFYVTLGSEWVLGQETIVPDAVYEEYEDSFHLGGGL